MAAAEPQDHNSAVAEMGAQQLGLLRHHLGYLQQASPYYRELFQQCGFSAAEFRSLADLTELPLTSKTELAERNRDFLGSSEEREHPVWRLIGGW